MNILHTVSTIMTTELVSVMADTPLPNARNTMFAHQFHHLLVVAPEGHLVGILSATDFLSAKLAGDDRATVGDAMTTKLAKLAPDDSLRTAISLFALNAFHALPVVENGRPVGIVTTLDIIRLLDRETPALTDYPGR